MPFSPHRTWCTFLPIPPLGVRDRTSYRFPGRTAREGGSALRGKILRIDLVTLCEGVNVDDFLTSVQSMSAETNH